MFQAIMSHNVGSDKLSSCFNWWIIFKFIYAYMQRNIRWKFLSNTS